MINLMYELGQARMADLHREAAAQHRAALVQASGTRRRWPSLRSLLPPRPGRVTEPQRGASIPAAPPSAPAPAARPSPT